MTYRNPRFCYRHLGKELGVSELSIASNSADANTPLYRVIDGASGRLFAFAAAGTGEIRFARAEQDRWIVNRLIIPAGHNLGGLTTPCRIVIQASQDGTWTDTATVNDLDGEPIVAYVAHPGLIDIRFEDISATGLTVIFQDSSIAGASVAYQFGELMFTRTDSAVTGIAHEFSDALDPQAEISTTRGGNAYALELADPKRAFTLEHQAVGAADDLVYRQLIDYVGVVRDAFEYEHPDSADAVYEPFDFTSTDDWTVTGATIQVAGSRGIDVTTTQTSWAWLWSTLPASDLRGKLLVVDFQGDTSLAWLDAASELRLALYSDDGTNVGQTQYNLATYPYDDQNTALFYRLTIDLDMVAQTSFVQPTTYSNVTIIKFGFNSGSIGTVVRWDRLQLIDKSKRPVSVKLAEIPERTQDSNNPSAFTNWRHTLSMLEYTT